MEAIRNQIQDGQHQANEVIGKINNIILELPKIARETFKQELRHRLNEITSPETNSISIPEI